MSAIVRSVAKRMAKRLIIQTGLEAVALAGGARIAPTAAGRGVIFTLHHVRPDFKRDYEPNGHLAITPQFLHSAIITARRAGLHPVHLEELPTLLSDPADKRNFMCFTLDDGYCDNARYAAPVFQEHGTPYTIFITPGFVERTRTIWWETAEQITRSASSFVFDFGHGEERVDCATSSAKFLAFERLAHFVQTTDEDLAVARIDALAKTVGIDPMGIVEDEIMTAAALRHAVADPLLRLGAHTMTHPNLARISEARVRTELDQSAARIAAYVGRQPTTIAFPYGSRDAVTARESAIARELGFVAAVTTQPGVLTPGDRTDFMHLPRVSLNGHYQKSRYVKALISGLPFRRT